MIIGNMPFSKSDLLISLYGSIYYFSNLVNWFMFLFFYHFIIFHIALLKKIVFVLGIIVHDCLKVDLLRFAILTHLQSTML